MHEFSGILLHMDLVDAHLLFAGVRLDLYASVAADWQIQLRNLIILWVVRIEIILTVKLAVLCDLAVCCKTNCDCILNYLLVQDRKGTWLAGTYRTGMTVRCPTKLG